MKYYLFLIMSCLIITVKAQDPATTRNALTDIQIKTPGLTDFIKYGNLSSTSYVGELKINLPLLSIPIPKNNPFEINLSYVGSGFRPAKRDGLVGQNWFLNVGGVITRQVNTVPDTHQGDPQTINSNPNHTNGFIYGVQKQKEIYNQTRSSQSVFDFAPNTSYSTSFLEEYLFANPVNDALDPNNYEGDPDIFSFNFNGISGKFFMGNDGLIKVATNTPNKLIIDISELNNELEYGQSCIPNVPSRIIITDEQGNRYYFGGETKNLEYTLTLPNVNQASSDDRPIINAWYLYKVEYYTGYILNFNYRDDSGLNSLYSGHFANELTIDHGGGRFNTYDEDPDDILNNSYLRDFLQLSEYYSENRFLYNSEGSFNGTGSVGGYSNHTLNLTLQKIAILESISGEDFDVNFGYSRQNKIFNSRDPNNPNEEPVNHSYFNDEFFDIRIDNISYRRRRNGSNVGGSIKSFAFNFDYMGGVHSRMFLKSLTESGLKIHKFDYYATGDLPKPITKGIDHWGFWNGNNANTNQLIPTTFLETNGDFTISGSSRNPNIIYAKKGQLERITYPTGGYSVFEYESHSYFNRLEAKSAGDFIPQLYSYNTSKIAGGTKIQKITDFENNLPINEKEYLYSGGTLLKWPRYALYYQFGVTGSIQGLGYIRSNPIGKNIMESLHMTYSEVTEQTNGNGYKITKFRDFTTNGDNYDSNWKDTNYSSGVSFIPSNGAGISKNYFAFLLNDRSIERGKPMWSKIFDASGNIKEETHFEYNENPLRFNTFSTAIHLTGLFIQSNKLYYYSDFLTQSINTKYLEGGVLTTTQNNEYHSIYNKLTKITINTSDNDVLINNNFYSFISNEHLILLDETESFKNNQLLSKQEIVYGDNLDAQTDYKYYPKEFANYKFGNQDQSTRSKVFIHQYDSKGNVLEVSKSDGTHTCYIWGYANFLPIAKIENTTYQIIAPFVSNLQTLSDIDTGSGTNNNSENNLRDALNNLRNEPSLSEALITTYTHNPHVGVTSMTDPRGNTIYYEYDVHERLIMVRDKDGNKLNRNYYNYKPQN